MKERYLHIKLPGPDEVTRYTSRGTRGESALPPRNRRFHGNYIQACLENAWKESESEIIATHSVRNGVYFEFESSPDFELVIKSLEDLRKGIRLCNVRKVKRLVSKDSIEEQVIVYATVYIPNDMKHFFFEKVEKYLNEETNKGNPKNAKLIESINDIRKAFLVESFWLDPKALIPREEPTWCEVWLRGGADEITNKFELMLDAQKIRYKSDYIEFPDRTVRLVYASQSQLEIITQNCDEIAEYRKAKDTAEFLLSQSPADQVEWIEDLLERMTVNDQSQTAICVLDTGINNGHPLLNPVLSSGDCQSVKSSWQSHDHCGHGTLMAGVSVFGDLQGKLESSEIVLINHVLESIKLLPPFGQNDPELWGDLTKQAVSLAVINAPERKRIFCMSITSEDTRDRGRPSSWSGAVDQITSGVGGEDRHLVILSAGNVTDFNSIAHYPNLQIRDSIHDPGQAWNALTIGAYTQLSNITEATLSGFKPLAGVNQLSPFSTTSRTWDDKWPIKPEVVFEGGNMAVDDHGFTTECDDLRLISTFYKPQEKLLECFSMTSAATAQAAHFAAQIQSKYPEYWPETIRALIVHSAKWPEELKSQFASNNSKTELKKVLHTCGYGVPNLDRAIYCASNSLTLIAESEIQPYQKDGIKYSTKDMHLYRLPWPMEILQELGEMEVEMRVTLSYFIEPGPGEIGWKDRYRYASHALRFDLNSPTETEDEFVRRINKASWDEENGKPDTPSAADHWLIGSQSRDKGSIHSDIWHGSASELASSNLIAVYPRIGWWRERHYLKRYNSLTRYSLIISIETPEQNIEQKIDIYTPVAIQVTHSVPVQVEVRR